jgi:hypothetical protein
MTETGEHMVPTRSQHRKELERQHNAQLLGLGAIALEMHQGGEIDAARLARLASRIAETEQELRLRSPR